MRDAVSRIEEKRALLAWLGKQTDTASIKFENYMCLSGVMMKAGWVNESEGMWRKGDIRLPMLDAARKEVAEQIEADTKAHLRRTVKNFKG